MNSSPGLTQAITSQQARDRDRYMAQRKREHQEHDHPIASTSPDFLRIIPHNTKARLAFSELIDKNNARQIDQHHAQYLVDRGRGPLETKHALKYKLGDETEDEHWSEASENKEVNHGYFRVNFDCPSLTDPLRWAVGKGSGQKAGVGNRNVDILLAVPRSRHAQGILAAHVFLKMHPESGVWMIFAAIGSSEEDVSTSSQIVTVSIDDEKVLEKEFRCLTKLQTLLKVQNMEFTVQFALKTFIDTQNYRELREKTLQRQNVSLPRSTISGIPLESDIRVGELAIISIGLGYGTFGSVYEGFDPISGDLRAIKVIEIKRKEAGECLEPELTISQTFGNTTGLVRQYGWHNSNGGTTLQVVSYPVKIYIVMDLGIAFHQHDWTSYGSRKPSLELRLCQELLTGLATMHSEGYMHRDITRQNILFFEARPQRSQLERAALCDFGKVHFGKSDTNTRLAAWDFLPPEIVEGKSRPYDHSIDVWMLALALVLCWYPQAENGIPRHRNRQITGEGIETMRTRLWQEPKSNLPLLLGRMLSEEPRARPTASQALAHLCFRDVPAERAEADEISDVKRTKMTREEEERL